MASLTRLAEAWQRRRPGAAVVAQVSAAAGAAIGGSPFGREFPHSVVTSEPPAGGHRTASTLICCQLRFRRQLFAGTVHRPGLRSFSINVDIEMSF